MRDAALKGLAVGFFDGVHLGHRAILRGASAALTFRNHPLTVLAPDRAPRLIMTPERRVAAIRACGVGKVALLDFTAELAALPPEEFVEKHLRPLLPDPDAPVLCGENWRFGKGGAGDAAFLRERGLKVEVRPYAEYAGERISSSRIRACLERGEIEAANAMMGRRFAVEGQLVKGKGLGSQIGYPTFNLQPSTFNLNLPLGVYEVEIAGQKGIANYGLAPTMGDRAWKVPVLEVHLINLQSSVFSFQFSVFSGQSSTFSGQSSEAAMTVEVIRFLRPERKFDSVTDLQRQIAADCAKIRL